MAKKKLNVKFLALVLAAVGVGVAVIGLVVLMQFRNDPVSHVATRYATEPHLDATLPAVTVKNDT